MAPESVKRRLTSLKEPAVQRLQDLLIFLNNTTSLRRRRFKFLRCSQLKLPSLPRQPPPPHVRNYPPPEQLFQNFTTQPQHQDPTPRSEEVHYNPPLTKPAQQDPPHSPDLDTPTHNHPSSQGNNFQEESHGTLPKLQEDSVVALQAILLVLNREQWTCVLSPIPRSKTKWYVLFL